MQQDQTVIEGDVLLHGVTIQDIPEDHKLGLES